MSVPGELSTYPVPPGAVPTLFQKKYPYFTTGDTSSSKAVVFIGGLFNGLLDPGYVGVLGERLKEVGWKLVLMHWSGAYEGFMSGSLDRDVNEMNALVEHLVAQGTSTIVLMGHSTGSQDVAHYLSTRSHPRVLGGIMQAPVSDREYFAWDPSATGELWRSKLPVAEGLVKAGKGDEALDDDFCRNVGGRMTAYRFFSLLGVGGDDDYFSHDIPNQPDGVHKHPLSLSFGKFSAPALALFSEKDEYVPPTFTYPGDLGERWVEACPTGLEWRVIPGAGHTVEKAEEREVLAKEVVGWLKRAIERQ